MPKRHAVGPSTNEAGHSESKEAEGRDAPPAAPDPFAGLNQARLSAEGAGTTSALQSTAPPNANGQCSIPKRSAEPNRYARCHTGDPRTAYRPQIARGTGPAVAAAMTTSPTITTEPPHYGLARARAIDGDTIEALVCLPLGIAVETRIRLKGFFGAEHHGRTPEAAAAAQRTLQTALDGHTLHVLARGSRRDKYGRLVAALIIDGVAADPHRILGPLQMTEAAHADDLVAARSSRTGKRGVL